MGTRRPKVGNKLTIDRQIVSRMTHRLMAQAEATHWLIVFRSLVSVPNFPCNFLSFRSICIHR